MVKLFLRKCYRYSIIHLIIKVIHIIGDKSLPRPDSTSLSIIELIAMKEIKSRDQHFIIGCKNCKFDSIIADKLITTYEDIDVPFVYNIGKQIFNTK